MACALPNPALLYSLDAEREPREGTRIMTAHHAVLWIDHSEAKLFKFVGDGVEKIDVHGHPNHHVRRDPDHHHEDKGYMEAVVKALGDCEEFLIVGPGKAKLELSRYLHKHAPSLEPKVVGIETVDHPSDGQLIAFAKKYFAKADALRS